MFFRQDLFSLTFRSAIDFFLFQRNSPPDNFIDTVERLNDDAADFSRIRCPLCRWQPLASSRWCCAYFPRSFHSGCGTIWNTFDTRGRCPGCSFQWKFTDCLRCHASSPHETWYENEPD